VFKDIKIHNYYVNPFENGFVTEYSQAVTHLEKIFKDIKSKEKILKRIFPIKCIVSYHKNSSDLELNALIDVFKEASGSFPLLVPEGIASIFNQNSYVAGNVGNYLICHIGFKVTELFILKDKKIVEEEAHKFGANDMFNLAKNFIKEKYNAITTNENIHSFFLQIDKNKTIEIQCKRLSDKKLLMLKINREEILDILAKELMFISDKIQMNMDQLLEQGQLLDTIYLTGGIFKYSFVVSAIKKKFNEKMEINNMSENIVYGLKKVYLNYKDFIVRGEKYI